MSWDKALVGAKVESQQVYMAKVMEAENGNSASVLGADFEWFVFGARHESETTNKV